MTDIIGSRDYARFLKDIRSRIQSAQISAARAVNRELVGLYREIGRMIVERQEQLGWGKSVVERLSSDIRKAFPDMKGFSTQNLWYMRQFFVEYREHANLQQLVGEIPWGHNVLILSNIAGRQ